MGPGKSIQKNFLPQSSSDFIYAIIVEEFGMIGAFFLLFLYLILLFRLVIVAHKASSMFGKLLVIGVGLPIVFQALFTSTGIHLFRIRVNAGFVSIKRKEVGRVWFVTYSHKVRRKIIYFELHYFFSSL